MTITVNTDAVRATASQVAAGAGEIENQLAALRGQINSLPGDWEGVDAQALETLYREWDSQAVALHETLVEIANAMTRAANNYDETTRANQGMFAG